MTTTRRAPYSYEDDERPARPVPVASRASAPLDRPSSAPGRRQRTTENGADLSQALRSRQSRRSTQTVTYDDDELEQPSRSTRTTTRHKLTVAEPKPQRGQVRIHSLAWVGVTMFVLVLSWIATTSGCAWWATHMSDPAQYGTLHGSVISAVVGGGDSPQSPTQFIGWNNHGHVLLIKVAGGDPSKAQMITGPDLQKSGFPDPSSAVVDVQVSDVDHDGKADLTVTIYADRYDLPFHRFSWVYVLYGDGKGGFKPQATTSNGKGVAA